MKLRTFFTSNVFLKIIFTLSTFLLFFIASLSYRQINALKASENLVSSSNQVNLSLEKLLSALKDAETGQRGFVLTHDTVYLSPYNGAKSAVSKSFSQLDSLTRNNQGQQKELYHLSNLLNRRFNILNAVIDQSMTESTPPISQTLKEKLSDGRVVMDSIRYQVQSMIDSEVNRLQLREADYKETMYFSPVWSFTLLLFSLIIFLLAFYKINRDSKFLKELNKQLVNKNDLFENSEKFSDMGSYSWNIDKNTIEYSNNLYRLLGYIPNQFSPTTETFYKHIASNEVPYIKDTIGDAIKRRGSFLIKTRVQTSGNTFKHIEITGKVLSSPKSLILVGIFRDITELHLFNEQLKEKNLELENINSELASFNHVASHDLQEPLRKIQILISRIDDDTTTALSKTSNEFFKRIQSSANRMQELIDDLLFFSKTDKGDKTFEDTDLNELVESTKVELAQLIEEKKAVIQSDKLPVAYVIPYQVKQLFINLISNSLKYSKADVAPVINIKSETVNWKELMDGDFTEKNYLKISISDNGIGFEQKYADNIFSLFQRLHSKEQYSGTGIGLTICKKIAENHRGFVTAEGVPGVGSTFSFYLPL